MMGDLKLGRAISRSRRSAEKLGKHTKNAVGALPEMSRKLESLTNDVKQVQAEHDAAMKKIIKEIGNEPAAAADPKSRRPIIPAALRELGEAARYPREPIVGEEAEKWIDSRTGGALYEPTESDPVFRPGPLPFASEIPVAMIADDFTYYSFKSEFQTHRLTPANWKEIFEKYRPQLFFCESAWQGGSPQERPWQGKIYASVRWPKENRTVLLDILDYCHEHKIPTVFWNKEDPTHFDDRINDFVRTAALFDYVFTTAEECVESYKKQAAVEHVGVLPFAVQPKLFNPQGIGEAADQANFAGTWYGTYPERSRAQARIMDKVLESERSLVIYDRMKQSPNSIYRYPERFIEYTKDPIPYEETAESYKMSRFGITLNTVTDSTTMFARRVFELAASGSVVLSNRARGVEEFFGDSVIYVDEDTEILQTLTDAEYLDYQRSALNIALRNTYTHRAEQVLATMGIPFQSKAQAPAAVAVVKSKDDVDQATAAFEQSSAYHELIVVVAQDATQSLEFELLQRRMPGVTVINERSLVNNEYRVRSFCRSPHFVRVVPGAPWPDEGAIEEMQLHTSHFEGQIRYSADADNRYETLEGPVEDGAFVPASFITSALSSDLIPTFTI